ncbi:MAG: non-heme iron oxygenase ferredoxin subunit [Candidatus Acidiferrales bacterium]
MAFVRAAKMADLPPGTIRQIDLDEKTIALANVDGKFYAINNVCLHESGPLGDGDLSGSTVTCPWHGWEYDVMTGKLLNNPAEGVESYSVEVRGDDIFVDV